MMNEYYQKKISNIFDNIDYARMHTCETYETIMRLPYLDLVFTNQRISKKEENKNNKGNNKGKNNK